jgi:glycosyltransferase involved in cell wall biosynthesis
MKILIINYRFLFSGGPERYMFNISGELEKRGHQIINFSVKNKKNEYSKYSQYFVRNIGNSNEYLFEKYKKTGLFYFDFLSREFYSFYVRRKLRNLLKIEKPDICYLLPHKGGLSPSIIDELKQNNIPIVHRISDYNILCPQGGLYSNRKFCDKCKTNRLNVIKKKCIKNSTSFSILKYLSSSVHLKLSLYNKVDYYITTNNFAKKQFINFGFDENKFTTIETFSSKIVRKKTKHIKDSVNFIYIGNIDDSKGIYDLIEATKLLLNDNPLITFTVNIYGGLRQYEVDSVKKILKESNLEKNILLNKMLPPDQIMNIYQDADITIIPARWVENLPNVLVESISFGTPVVVPNFGSFSSVVDNTVAFFFEKYDPNSLKETLLTILTNPSLILEKSEKCFDFANERFNKDVHTEKLISIFDKYITK